MNNSKQNEQISMNLLTMLNCLLSIHNFNNGHFEGGTRYMLYVIGIII